MHVYRVLETKKNIHSILSGHLSDNFEAAKTKGKQKVSRRKADGKAKAAGKFLLFGIQMQAIKPKKLAYCKGE